MSLADPIGTPVRHASGTTSGAFVAFIVATTFISFVGVILLSRNDLGAVIMAAGVLLSTAWIIACLRNPVVAVWGLLLWIPVQGWVQLNLFNNADWSVLLCDVQTALVYGAVCVKWLQKSRRWRSPRVFLLAFPFVIWFLLLIPYSIPRTGWLLIAIALRTYLFPLGLVIVGFCTFRNRRDLTSVGLVLMVQMALIAIVTVLQYRRWAPKDGEITVVPLGYVAPGVLRPPGTFSFPGHLGMYVLAMIPLGVGLANLKGLTRWRRILVIGGLVGAGVALAVNTQRSTIVLLVVILPLIFIIARRVTFRNIVYGAIAVSIVIGAGSVFTGGAFSQRIVSIRDNLRLALIDAPRERMLQALETPLFGRGLGSASPGSERLRITTEVSAESYMAALVFEGGIPALMFYYAFLFALLWFGFRSVARCRSRDLKLMAAAIVSYEIGIWLQSWTYDPLHHLPSQLIFWFWAGALLALPRLEFTEHREPMSPHVMRTVNGVSSQS